MPDSYLPRLRDENGNSSTGVYDFDSGNGFNARQFFTPPRTGAYYIIASPDLGRLGDYRLSVTDITPAEPDISADTSTTARLEIGGAPSDGFIRHGGDQDWHVAALEASKSYRVTVKGVAPFTVVGIAGIRYGDESAVQPGTTLANGRQGNPNKFVFTPTRSGDYYIDIGNAGCCATEGWVGPYSIKVELVETIDSANFSDIVANATAATLGEAHSGRASDPPDDSGAWFSIELEAGKTYETELTWPESNLRGGNYLPPYRRGVYDAEGSVIAGSNQGEFSPPETATYYIRIGRNIFRPHPMDFGSGFGVTVREAAPTTAPPSEDQELFASRSDDDTVTLTVVQTTGGSIEDPDTENDWYQVDLTGGDGKTYWVEVNGQGVAGYTLGLPWVRAIFTSDGTVVYADAGAHSVAGGFELQPAEDTTFYVVVRGKPNLSSGTDGTGTYGILVSDTTPPDEQADLPADTSTSGRATVGGAVYGELVGALDVDWYRVELQGGVSYQIDQRGPWSGRLTEDGWVVPGTMHAPQLQGIYDSSGELIEGTDTEVNSDGLDSRIESFIPDADGYYYIAASSEGGTSTGTYQLSITVLE